ncbi:MAG: class I SAM-dependent methyltransferase [Flavobacteriales bacterium]
MRRVLKFIGHWLRSNSRHGTHSPFVYDLIEKALYSESKTDKSIRKHFDKLKSSSQPIKGVDYGTLSNQEVVLNVGDLANRSAAKNFESDLLSKLVAYHQPTRVLELGTNLGKSSAYMAGANGETSVKSVEGNAQMAEFAEAQFAQLNLSNIQVRNETFDQFFAANSEKFHFVFIDGDHSYDSTLRYYDRAKKCLEGEGPIVLHDIYWSDDMNRAWEKIKADVDTTVTIDLFFFALVYFRKGQRKEHFNIRYPKSLFLLLS